MRIVNLTPHELTIHGENGDVIVAPSGNVARVASERKISRREVVDGVTIPFYSVVFGEVEGLPDATEGVLLAVSGLVKSRVPDRSDVISPGQLVRGDDGQPTGCRGVTV